jgi:hypothetical protein
MAQASQPQAPWPMPLCYEEQEMGGEIWVANHFTSQGHPPGSFLFQWASKLISGEKRYSIANL